MGVTIDARRGTVGSPAGVCNASMAVKHLCHVWLRFGDKLFELGNFADLLEGEDFIFLVAVDSETC